MGGNAQTGRTIAVVAGDAGATRAMQALLEYREEGAADLRTLALVRGSAVRGTVTQAVDEVVAFQGSLEETLQACGAGAVWTGWGPGAWDDEQCARVERLGIRTLGARRLAVDAGERSPGTGALRLLAVDLASDLRSQPSLPWILGIRDRTVSVRETCLLEECPADLSSVLADRVRRAALAIWGRAATRPGIGTVLFEAAERDEALAVLGAWEGPDPGQSTTEETVGLDLVKLHLHLALGGWLEDPPPVQSGHAIAVHVRAEDPARDFAAAPGRVSLLRVPTGPGIRADTTLRVGETTGIPVVGAGAGPTQPRTDLMTIAAWGRSRVESLARARWAVSELAILVASGCTTAGFLAAVLDHPHVREGPPNAGAAGSILASAMGQMSRHADAALIVAAIFAHEEDLVRARARFLSSAARGRPEVDVAAGRDVEVEHLGHRYRFRVSRTSARGYRLRIDGAILEATLDPPLSLERRVLGTERLLTYSGGRRRVLTSMDGPDLLIQVAGVTHRVGRADRGAVLAPAPAVVVAVHVSPGQLVAEGDPLLVLEAMKMETTVTAPWAGTVRRLAVATNVQVDAGTPLLQIVGDRVRTSSQEGARVSFVPPSPAEPSPADPLAALDEVRRLVLGFDVEPIDEWRIRAASQLDGPDAAWSEAEVSAAEDQVLEAFTDLSSLFEQGRSADVEGDEELVHVRNDLLLFLRSWEVDAGVPPSRFVETLRAALRHYGRSGPDALERSAALEEALFRVFRARERLVEQIPLVIAILDRRLEELEGDEERPDRHSPRGSRELFDRLAAVTRRAHPQVSDLATEVRYRAFDRAMFERARENVYREMEAALTGLRSGVGTSEELEAMRRVVVDCPQPLERLLLVRLPTVDPATGGLILDVMVRRFYRIRDLEGLRAVVRAGRTVVMGSYPHDGTRVHVMAIDAGGASVSEVTDAIRSDLEAVPVDDDIVIDYYLWRSGDRPDPAVLAGELETSLSAVSFGRPIRRIVVTVASATLTGKAMIDHFTFRPTTDGYREELVYRGLHPMMGKRLQIWRLGSFEIERLPSVEDLYLFHGVARANPKDERIFALAEVRDLTPVTDDSGTVVALPHLERMLTEALAGIRRVQSRRPAGRRLQWNRVLLYVWPPVDLSLEELHSVVRRLAPITEGLGLEAVVVLARWRDRRTGRVEDRVLRISSPTGRTLAFRFERGPNAPVEPLSEYMQKVVQSRQRGLAYPYEVVRMITPSEQDDTAGFPHGTFVEHDLDDRGRLVPVERPFGQNSANVVAGLITNITPAYPQGMTRVILLGDPSRSLGSLAERECRRIIGALDLAERLGVPLEWFALSAGAKISMDSGTENMDWIGRVLRRLIEYTQRGGEVNVVVAGINVGAQPYWNAEATMLMHTRGILVMTPDSAMVLTGKQALDYSGGVSAEDNFGIGGYEGVMGPNGQGQYWARDLEEAARILFRHYDHTYVVPGERFPRRVPTSDPYDRDIRSYPHRGQPSSPFVTVGEIFSDRSNPGRKKPFDIRSVMRSVVDQDRRPLERWTDMRDAEVAVVWDAHVGGFPVCLLGLESRPLPRRGVIPADGPDHWTGGTLFPLSSKKVARSINAASGNRPVVVLANLSGFDGSPDSMRSLQLEYGAEIGRAVTNFQGPMVFVVISRYHGGAFVVFSATLNEGLEIVALEGAYASVIGGAPAAAVVFSREVEERTKANPLVRDLGERLATASGEERAKLRAEWEEVTATVRSEKLGDVADEYDAVHDISRAKRVGSVREIITPSRLRPYLVDAVERGVARELERVGLAR